MFSLFLYLLYSCTATYKIDVKCINEKPSKNEKIKIIRQIDSVFYSSSLQCDKFKKIVYSKCSEKKILEIKVKTRCEDYRYFYFDKNFKMFKVIRELKEIH